MVPEEIPEPFEIPAFYAEIRQRSGSYLITIPADLVNTLVFPLGKNIYPGRKVKVQVTIE